MTIKQILDRVGERKPITTKTFYRYLAACKIKPAGARQKPQQYPDDTPDRILAHLGLQIVSMAELRRERTRATRKTNGHAPLPRVPLNSKRGGAR